MLHTTCCTFHCGACTMILILKGLPVVPWPREMLTAADAVSSIAGPPPLLLLGMTAWKDSTCVHRQCYIYGGHVALPWCACQARRALAVVICVSNIQLQLQAVCIANACMRCSYAHSLTFPSTTSQLSERHIPEYSDSLQIIFLGPPYTTIQ